MAEIAGSIVGIVAFGLHLSKRLYQFGSTASGAKSEIDYVARNVTNYVDTLNLLGDRLNDEDLPISKRGQRIAERLCKESEDLFCRIQDLLPESPLGKRELNFWQRVTWDFKKSKVEFFAGQIECLKTTTTLLATILFAGKKIKRKRGSYGGGNTNDTSPNIEDVSKEFVRANISVVEQYEACQRLKSLERAVICEEASSSHNAPEQQAGPLALRQTFDSKDMQDLAVLQQDVPITSTQRLLNGSPSHFWKLIGQWTTALEDDFAPDEVAETQSREKSNMNHKVNDRKASFQGTSRDSKSRENGTTRMDTAARKLSPTSHTRHRCNESSIKIENQSENSKNHVPSAPQRSETGATTGFVEDLVAHVAQPGFQNHFGSGKSNDRFAQLARDDKSSDQPSEVIVKESTLLLSLEELFEGAHKKLEVTRKRMGHDGTHDDERLILDIEVPPGLKAGSKFKFSGRGDEIRKGFFQDLHLIVFEKEHDIFYRKENDLVTHITLSGEECCSKWFREIRTIDGTLLPISGNGLEDLETCSLTFRELGMPLRKNPQLRGNLIVVIEAESIPI